MEQTLFLAKFWGWLLVVISLVFLLRKKILSEELFKLMEEKNFVLISGYLALILGLITIILHNVWTFDWRVIITLFGWLSLIKGILRLSFPEISQKTVQILKKRILLTRLLLIIALILGSWLIWISYY